MNLPNRTELVEVFLSRGLSPRTSASYARILEAAAGRAARSGEDLAEISGHALVRLAATFPRTRASQAQLKAALGHWWVATERPNPPLWAIRPPRKPKMRCRALSEADAARLDAFARSEGGLAGAAATLGLYAALRAHEIAKLRWEEISDGWLKVVGKGGVSAELPLHPSVLEVLGSLERTSEYVFPGRGREHVTGQTIWNWITALAVEGGVGHVSPHQLRHTCLATANDLTGDLRAVQELARHARPETTAGYTRVGQRRLAAVVISIDYSRALEEAC